MRPIYDEILFQDRDWIAVPTLGSIIENWLLIVPRRWSLNFASWHRATSQEPIALVRRLLAHWEISLDRAIWFEHGARAQGTSTACGVDHAHLHLLIDAPFSYREFIDLAVDEQNLNWHKVPVETAYPAISANSSYFVAGQQNQAFLAEDVEAAGSQFFRRVIARLVARPEEWNYKQYPHLENVRATITNLGDRA